MEGACGGEHCSWKGPVGGEHWHGVPCLTASKIMHRTVRWSFRLSRLHPSLSRARARALSPHPFPFLRARLRATASKKECSKTGRRPRIPTLSPLHLPRARSARVRCPPARSRLALLSSCRALVLPASSFVACACTRCRCLLASGLRWSACSGALSVWLNKSGCVWVWVGVGGWACACLCSLVSVFVLSLVRVRLHPSGLDANSTYIFVELAEGIAKTFHGKDLF